VTDILFVGPFCKFPSHSYSAGRFQWARGLNFGLRLVPSLIEGSSPGVDMEVYLLSGRGLCDWLIT
jgi:hypothetical protein